MTPEKNTPQGIGSCITYSRRYGLSSIIGIVSDADDDGNEASATDTKTTAKPKAEPANVAPPLDLPKGKDWWCSSHNGKAYVLTKNKNKRYARAFLDAQGFRLNEKTGTFSHLHSDELVRLFQKMDEEVVSEFQTNMDEVFP